MGGNLADCVKKCECILFVGAVVPVPSGTLSFNWLRSCEKERKTNGIRQWIQA